MNGIKKYKIYDISTPLFNHWRWKLDIWEDEKIINGKKRIESNFIFSGHGLITVMLPDI